MKSTCPLACVLLASCLLLGGLSQNASAAKPAPPPMPSAPQAPQTQLGNIFFDNEPVVIQALTSSDSATYSIKDFWGKEVDSGKADVANGIAQIKPNIKAHGYYELTVNPGTENKLMTFGIIAPIKYADMADSPFCVCTHFHQGHWDLDLLPLIPRLGIAQVREDLPWRGIENKQEGQYDFSSIDPIYSAIHDAGITILPCAAYCSAKLYDHTEFPTSQHGWDGFANFCVAALQHYPYLTQVELWNEYNGTWGPPKNTPNDKKPVLYAGMEKTVYTAVKQANQNVSVLGGAMVRVPLPYMESFFQAGGLDSLDGVVVHPYIGTPEVFWRTFNAARALMKKYNNGQEKPLYATEYSWGSWSTRDPMQHAEFLVRSSVIMSAENVKRMYWFELRDWPSFPNGQCILHSDTDPRGKYSPTPSAIAMATLIRALHDGTYEAREADTPFTRTWVFRFHNKQGEQIRALWYSGDGTSQVTLNASGPLTKIDIMGGESQVTPDNGKVTLTLSEEPFFLKGAASNVQEVPTQWKTIANSVDDASDTQGTNGWHPGYFTASPGPAPDSVDASSFQEMTLHTDNWGYRWNGPGDCRVSDSSDLWTAKEAMPSNRWVSTMTGKVTLRGSFSVTRSNKENFQNMESAIYVNGKQVFAKETPTPQPIPGHAYTATFEVPVDIKAGDTVDFVVPQGTTGANHPRVDASICVPNPDYHS
jgi:hypothetical protein